MRLQLVLGVSALVILPSVSYFCGRSLTPLVTYLASKPSEPLPTIRVTQAPAVLHAESAAHVPFVDLYRSLQASSYASRSDRVRELTRITDPRQRRPALVSLFKCLALLDPQEALTFLPQLENEADRVKAVDSIIKAAPSAATAALVRRLTAMDDAIGEHFRTHQLPGQIAFWSALDPVAAAQFVEEHPDLMARIGETSLLTNWAAIDPAAATAWLQSHPAVIANEEVLNDYVHGLFQNNPEIARQYVIDNATDPRFVNFIAPVAAQSYYRSPAVAESFIRQLPDSETRSRALFAIGNIQAELSATSENRADEYQRLASWLDRFPLEERSPSLTGLFSKWSKAEPGEALHWLGALPSEDQQAVTNTYGRVATPENWPTIISAADEQLHGSFLASFARAWNGTAGEIETTAQAYGLSPTDAKVLKHLVEERQP